MLPSVNNTTNSTEINLVKSEINTYFLLSIAFIAIPFFCVSFSFDEKPPTAPSASASQPRTNLKGIFFVPILKLHLFGPKFDHCATFSLIQIPPSAFFGRDK